MTRAAPLIRVLVVDDSAFVRKVVSRMLSRSPLIEIVGTARDGEEALEMVALHHPNVVTLDLVMPRMNGVEFLRRQMAIAPLPVVLCSIAHESGEMALDALELGAVDFVQKPTALATDKIYEIADELLAKVKTAAKAVVARAHETPVASHSSALPKRPQIVVSPSRVATSVDVVVLGISTGGPQALRQLIPQFPADFPVPIVMVMHMPVGYTEMYARRLNDISHVEVVEASDGQSLHPGLAVLAPAGQHLSLVRRPNGSITTRLDSVPVDTQHRPSVDVLFRSAAEVYGSRVLGVVMTGMGSDGLSGAMQIKAGGGRIVTEDQSSCVVYGMPRAIVDASLSDRSVPLDQLARTITEMACDEERTDVSTIMVVDDSTFARRVHRRMLESAGHRVVEASTGLGALELYSLERPELVLLDLSMEDLSGGDVLRQLREIDPSVRVIVISADVQRSTERLVMDAGALRFLGKPVAQNSLLQAISAILENSVT